MSDRRGTKWRSGRLTWSPIRGFWQLPLTLDEADPEIPNLPLLAPAVAGDVDISGAILEGSDAVAGTVAVVVSISGAVTEGSDVVAGDVDVVVRVSGAVLEGSDIVVGVVSVAVSVSGAIQEGSDAVAGTVEVEADEVDISGDVLEGSDSVLGFLEFIAPSRPFGSYGVSFRRKKNEELEVQIDEKADRVELRRFLEERMTDSKLSSEEIQLNLSKKDLDTIIVAILASEL